MTLQQFTKFLRGVVWLYLCFMVHVTSSSAQDDTDISQIPSRPYNHVMDEARWLKVQEREKIQQELSRRFVEQQIDLYLVIVRDAPAQGMKNYARTLGEAWSRAPVWCVIIHVPGNPAGVHVEAGGAEIAQPRIEKAVQDALKRSRREMTEKDRVIAACHECANDLRYVLASHQRMTERTTEAVDKMIAHRSNRTKKIKLLAIGSGIFLILTVIVIYFVVRMVKRRRTQFLFPDTVWRERFLGPHSGGGGITVSFK